MAMDQMRVRVTLVGGTQRDFDAAEWDVGFNGECVWVFSNEEGTNRALAIFAPGQWVSVEGPVRGAVRRTRTPDETIREMQRRGSGP